MVVLFKACPRCTGDLLVNSDIYGRYVECLQCGYMGAYTGELVAKQPAVKGKALAETSVGVRGKAA